MSGMLVGVLVQVHQKVTTGHACILHRSLTRALQLLLEMAQTRDEDIPALVFEARPTVGAQPCVGKVIIGCS